MAYGHRRVRPIKRENNLPAMQPRMFVVTTDSRHGLNLGSRLVDIAHVCLHGELLYLGAVPDALSRKVVG